MVSIKKLLIQLLLCTVLAVFFASAIFVSNELMLKYRADRSVAIKDFVIKKTSPVVLGQPVNYSVLIKRSQITKDRYLAPIPKKAFNLSIRSITDKDAQHIISKTLQKPKPPVSQIQVKKISNSLFKKSISSLLDGVLQIQEKSLNAITKVVLAGNEKLLQLWNTDFIDLKTYGLAALIKNDTDQVPMAEPAEEAPAQPETIEPAASEPAVNEPAVENGETEPEGDTGTDIELPASSDAPGESSIQPPAEEPTESTPADNNETPEDTSPEGGVAGESTIDETVQIIDEYVEITYQLPAPKIEEQETEKGKLVIISAPDEAEIPSESVYTNVLAFTEIPEMFNVGQEDKIKITWKNNNNEKMQFTAYDTDDNGKLDRIEWIVPHLSEQTFEIIFLTKALKLDQNQEIIADIFEIVKSKDGNYETIENNQYARITFEKILASNNDVTLYARSAEGATVEVYPVYEDANGEHVQGPLVATFKNISEEGFYKVLLSSLQTPTDIFDLKIIGTIEIDTAFDPTRTISNAGGNWNATATWVEGIVPTAADDVVATATSGNVTITAAAVARSVNLTNYVGTLTHNAGVTLSIGDATAGASNNALIFPSSGWTYTLGNTATSAISFVSTSTTQQNVNFGGQTTADVTFDGSGGSWILTGGWTAGIGSLVTLTRGTLDTNGQLVSWSSFNSSNTNTRTLTLASIGTITLTGVSLVWDLSTTTNLTFSGGSNTINATGGAAVFKGGGLTYFTVKFTGAEAAEITGANSFGTLERTGTATKTSQLILHANQTVTTGLTLAGNSVVNRLLIKSDTLGTARTITNNGLTNSFSNSDFQDITGAGTGSWGLSAITGNSGDAGGNSGITFTTAAAQTWNGTSGGNWSTNTWTSRVPLPQDDVTINAAFSASQTVTADMPRLGKSITWAGATGTPTWNISSIDNTLYGSLTLVSGMNLTTDITSLIFEGRGSFTFTSAGKTFGSTTVQMVSGTLTLQDTLTVSSSKILDHNNGTLTANNQNLSLGTFRTNSSATRTMNMGSGTWTLTGTNAVWNMVATAGLTFNANTSTIDITDTSATSKNFVGANLTYNIVTFTGDNITVTGSNTFSTFNLNTAGRTNGLKLTSGTTQTVTTFASNGAVGSLAKLVSTSAGSAATISKSSGTVSEDYMSLQDSTATGGAAWYAGANSTNVSGNTGWIFTVPPTITGTVYTDEGVTNIGANKTVAISINGAAAAATATTDTNGAFSLGSVGAAGDVLTLYIDGATEKGVTVTKGTGAGLSNIHIFKDYLITRCDNACSLTNANLDTADNNADADITGIYSVSAGALTVAAGKSLYIPLGYTFAPGGTVSVGGNFRNFGTFTHGSSTVTLTGTGSHTLRTNASALNNLTINGAGGTYTLSNSLTVNDTVTITAGTLESPEAFNINTKSWIDTGTGTFTENQGSITFNVAGGTINSNESFNNVTINHAGTTTLGAALDLADTLTLTAGTLDVSASNFGITAKSWTDTGAGTFTEGTGTVTFDVAGGTINSNEAFYNITINHGGASTLLGAAMTVGNNLTITTGGLDVNLSGSYAISVGGNWSNSGNFTPRSGTVTFTATATGKTIASTGVVSFYNLTFNGVGGGWTLQGSITVSNVLTITNGTFIINSNISLTLSGTTGTPFTNAGTFTASNGTVSYTGNNGSGNTTVANVTYYGLTINNASETYVLAGNTTINNNLIITAGILDASASDYSLSVGNVWSNSGTFTARNGTVTLTSTSPSSNLTSGGSSFYNLIQNSIGAGAGYILQDALSVSNNLTISAGTLDVGAFNYGVTVGGNWSNSGTFTAGSGTVTFNATTTGKTITTGGSVFYNLTFNGVGGGWTLQDATQVNNVLTITAGTLNGGSITLTLSGTTGTPFSNSGTFTAATGTVAYTGNNVVGNTTVANVTYNNLTINNSSETYVLSAALDVNDTLTLTAGTLDVSVSNFGITAKSWTDTGAGTFTERAGTVTFDVAGGTINSNEAFYNVTIDHAGTTTLGAALDLDNNLTLTTGSLDVSASNYEITIAKDWNNSTGTFIEQSGTVTFNGNVSQALTGETFYNLTISNFASAPSDTVDVDTSAAVTVTNTLTIADGQFQPTTGSDFNGAVAINAAGILKPDASASITVAGNWTNTGTFTHNSGTVTFDGTGSLNSSGALNGTFFNATINGSGITVTLVVALDIEETLTITAGTLDVSVNDLGITAKSWIDTGNGTFNERSGTVTFDVAGGTINSNETFNNVTINHAGTTTLGAALDLADTLTLTAGTLDVSASNFGITAKSWTDTGVGTFTEGSGTVTFDVAGGTINANETFNNITINHAGTTTLGADTSVAGAFTITAGTLSASTYTITLSGTGTILSNSGTFSAGTSTISITNTSSTTKTFAGGGGTFNNLTITGAGSGAVIFTSSNTFNNFTINPPKTVTFTSSTTQTISGTFSCAGTSGNVITINSSSAGTAGTLSKSSGTVSCDYLHVTDSAATGGATWNAGTNSTDNGGNSGWVFNTASSAASSTSSGSGGSVNLSKGEPLVVLINNGQLSTDSRDVVLTFGIGSRRVTEMLISNNPYFAGSVREPYQPAEVWKLTDGNGVKTVYVKFFNDYGFISDTIFSQITYKAKLSFFERIIERFIGPRPPVTVEIPKETPESFKGWDLVRVQPIGPINIVRVPTDLEFFAQKFPQFDQLLAEIGLNKTAKEEAKKIAGFEFDLPGFTQMSLASNTIKNPLERSLALPLASLTLLEKENIPSDVVFIKAANGLIDINTKLSFNREAKAQQKFNVAMNTPLQLLIKPAMPVKSINGFVAINEKVTKAKDSEFLRADQVGLGKIKSAFLGGLKYFTASFAQALEVPNLDPQTELVLQRFAYEKKENGFWVAELTAPPVEGTYEIINIMESNDPSVTPREIHLITVVDPEGYVYQQLPEGRLRIEGAAVSLYWLNPQNGQYELWPAKTYLQENPFTTDETGKYAFLSPEGTYYLEAFAPGYQPYKSEIFTISKGTLGIHVDIELRKEKSLFAWPAWPLWKFALIIMLGLLTCVLLYVIYKVFKKPAVIPPQTNSYE